MSQEKKKTGAVIILDGHKNPRDVKEAMVPVGDSTVIRRMLGTLEHAGVEPIVLVTGAEREQIEKHVSGLPVLHLYHPAYQKAQMLDGIKLGLSYIRHLCQQVLVMPARYPLLLADTLHAIMYCGYKTVVPVYGGRRGHPVLLGEAVIPRILAYKGEEGLGGALRQEAVKKLVFELSVKDAGIICPALRETDSYFQGEINPGMETYTRVRLELKKDNVFFDGETARFLGLIDYVGSMQTACRQMHISYSRGWKIIKEAQLQLGFELLQTRTGGQDGGASVLTEKGRRLLADYQNLQERLEQEAKTLFRTWKLN